MSFRSFLWPAFAISVICFAQANHNVGPMPPVPPDPFELVTAPAQATGDPESRNAAIAMLNKARMLSNVRAQPYDLKTSFIASGGTAGDGTWSLEDISPGQSKYRWTAIGAGYSVVNLYTDSTRGILYSSSSSTTLPLRLAQVRNALFFAFPMLGPYASIRTATGSLNGAEQRCVLVVQGAGSRVFDGARNWEESEFCMDANSGLLTTYSPAPGLFVHYDYSAGLQFHGKSIAGAFTLTEAGRTVIEAKTVSVAEPPTPDNAMFTTAGLTAAGVGRTMTPAGHMRFHVSSSDSTNVQVVVLHGTISASGGGIEQVEVLASSDPSKDQTALARFGKAPFSFGTSAGATPPSSEVFMTVEFDPPSTRSAAP
jgi:hypothetical protein